MVVIKYNITDSQITYAIRNGSGEGALEHINTWVFKITATKRKYVQWTFD
jgi:hypothetical protein